MVRFQWFLLLLKFSFIDPQGFGWYNIRWTIRQTRVCYCLLLNIFSSKLFFVNMYIFFCYIRCKRKVHYQQLFHQVFFPIQMPCPMVVHLHHRQLIVSVRFLFLWLFSFETYVLIAVYSKLVLVRFYALNYTNRTNAFLQF